LKTLDLNNICEVLGIKYLGRDTTTIEKVVTSVSEIENQTLVFHLHKIASLNIKKLESLNNCIIITDQPLLKKYRHLIDKFIYVLDVEKTYEQFIMYYRLLFDVKTIGVTGTCGKTTTKEMIKQVLGKKYQVTGTILSKNSLRFNHQYLMDIDDSTNYGVYEMGLTDPGNILYSAKFFKPSIGVITNIGIDHLSGCKTLENYILAKSEMLAALENKGTLVINGDCENTQKIDFSQFKGKILTIGKHTKFDYNASHIRFGKNSMHFILNQKFEVTIPGLGEHNVYNALTALAVLDTLGMSMEESIADLASFKPVKSHFEIHKGINHSTIIDDTWSSNPTSMKAAFEAFKVKHKTKVAVLGNISYLGEFALEQCKEIGKMVVDYQIDYLITIDSFSKKIGEAAITYGMDIEHVFHCKNDEDIKNVLYHLIKPDVVVLFKTSMLDNKINKIIKYFIKGDL